jgi:hypothetical protein
MYTETSAQEEHAYGGRRHRRDRRVEAGADAPLDRRLRRAPPLIYLNSVDQFTVSVGLAFFQGQFATEYTRLMAGVMLSVLPIMVVYSFAQQYFTRGINLSGLKG